MIDLSGDLKTGDALATNPPLEDSNEGVTSKYNLDPDPEAEAYTNATIEENVSTKVIRFVVRNSLRIILMTIIGIVILVCTLCVFFSDFTVAEGNKKSKMIIYYMNLFRKNAMR